MFLYLLLPIGFWEYMMMTEDSNLLEASQWQVNFPKWNRVMHVSDMHELPFGLFDEQYQSAMPQLE